MDYANDNAPTEITRYRGTPWLLALAVFTSLAAWFVIKLTLRRALRG